jgi:hypothetical protein
LCLACEGTDWLRELLDRRVSLDEHVVRLRSILFRATGDR